MGGANYHGDLMGRSISVLGTRLAMGVGGYYDIDDRFGVGVDLQFAHLGAHDRNQTESSGLRSRNLSFHTRLVEFSAMARYKFGYGETVPFIPYAMAGLAIGRINPFAFDSRGDKVFLFPLRTEGQNLPEYPEKLVQNRTILAIPFGAGVTLQLTERINLDIELGWRKTFTDYIDDVSGTYADPAVLQRWQGAKAVEMSYRGDELPGGNSAYPAAGTQRGNSGSNDAYRIGLLRFRFVLFQGNQYMPSGSKRTLFRSSDWPYGRR
jgi:opacity protein-like surface antigen